ncbi:hypothetical protein [Actinomadura sp. WMMB 499]|uniref:hypothetical protein n=1 Tax=Actinomadura sp. WMMB 499 TaxID=1219491 RepID=UPI00159D9C79|nr:hypothetical protein [Actinomadura sp. WMMB 499]
MSDGDGARLIAVRYARAFNVTVIGIVAVWHAGYDPVIITRGWPMYDPAAAVIAAWLLLAAAQAAGAALVLRSALDARAARALAAVTLAAGELAAAAYPPGAAISDLSWASNTVGWTGVMLLVRRPFREPVLFMLVNIGGTAAHMVLDGSLDHVAVTRLITVAYTTAGVQLTFAWLGGRLHGAARNATETAGRQAAGRARAAAEEAVHAERRRRYEYLRTRVRPVLHGLATGRMDPGDDAVRHRVALEAARLRRLFAETDDTPHPLLHELRACADVAERRGVAVTLLGYGDVPPLSAAARRALAEGPLLVLAAAATWARVTVVAGRGEVVVGVVADAAAKVAADVAAQPGGPAAPSVMHDREENRLWVETRWSPGGSP